jgi:hypothetical protein
VADDERDPRGLERRDRPADVLEDRRAEALDEDLRDGAGEPLPLPGGEDDDGGRAGSRRHR